MDYVFDFLLDGLEENTKDGKITELPIKKTDNLLDYIEQVYKHLMVMGLCSNSVQFSVDVLHKSKNYYACLKTLQHQPSLATIHTLIAKLDEIANSSTIPHYKKTKIVQLVEMGYQLLFKKYMGKV